MAKVHYKIVPHDGGWAYTLDGVFSEPFASHDAARVAALRVAREQHVPGETATIEFEGPDGVWYTELADGSDRPEADVSG
jgi:hypothetical protein